MALATIICERWRDMTKKKKQVTIGLKYLYLYSRRAFYGFFSSVLGNTIYRLQLHLTFFNLGNSFKK